MSIKLAKDLVCSERPLSDLEGKTISIDIAPWLYKYLYVYNNSKENLKNSKGVITGHLLGFLYFLKNLKKHKIIPVICLDGSPPDIKKQLIEKRINQRKKAMERYDILQKHGLELTSKQKISKLNSSLYIGSKEKKLIEICCKYLGISYYFSPFVEGEKACSKLKIKGYVDECLTPDRDAIIYGVSFYSKIDFKNQKIMFYDYNLNCSKLGIKTHEQLIQAIICSGSDYSKGLYGIGPKKILSLLSDSIKLNSLIVEHIPNYMEIYDVLCSQIPLSGLHKESPNPIQFIEFLRELEFKEQNIIHFCNFLF